VMTGPQDPAAARGDRIRAGHADREQVIEALKDAFVHGRLTKDELDLRVSQALASRTYAELATLTADLPAGLTIAKPPQSAPARARGGQPVLRPGPVIKAATALYACVWVYASFFPKGANGPSIFLALTFDGGFVYLIILAICLGQMVALRRERRSGGQTPRRPAAGAGGPAAQRLPSSDPDRELPPRRPRSSECSAPMPRGTVTAARGLVPG
jgi:Domain of unknown function (DUF1707)